MAWRYSEIWLWETWSNLKPNKSIGVLKNCIKKDFSFVIGHSNMQFVGLLILHFKRSRRIGSLWHQTKVQRLLEAVLIQWRIKTIQPVCLQTPEPYVFTETRVSEREGKRNVASDVIGLNPTPSWSMYFFHDKGKQLLSRQVGTESH